MSQKYQVPLGDTRRYRPPLKDSLPKISKNLIPPENTPFQNSPVLLRSGCCSYHACSHRHNISYGNHLI